ncbi:MAG: prephenate dehydrogenase/arogenate dehydrogenase family protein [Candidatus Nanoarchaeia archaeon]
MRRLGIVGYGDFIHFFVPHLKPFFDEIIVYSRRDVSIDAQRAGAEQKSFEEVCSCEFVCNAVVVQYFEETMQKILPYLQQDACVFDVCSVKEIPIEIMKQYVPNNCHIIATHPLFGPNSGKNGIKGLNMVLINVRASDKILNFFDEMFFEMKLRLHYITAKKHDEDMAYVQALSHFIAQGIKEFGGLRQNTLITTQAYESLLDIEENISRDSWLLFESIEKYNNYSKDIRDKFVASLEIVNKKLR